MSPCYNFFLRFVFTEPAGVAQLVEQLIRNQQVVSSSLTAGSSFPRLAATSTRAITKPGCAVSDFVARR